MTRATSLALALLTLAGTAAEPASKTVVTVKFVLNAYPNDFDTGQIAELQNRAAAEIVARLLEHAPFLGFTAQEGNPFTLTAKLRPRLTAERSGAPGEVIFQFTLEGPRIAANAEYVVFRPANDLSAIPLLDGFVEEIALRLTEEVYRGQLRPLLFKVPIAKTGEVLSNPAGWLLPYERHEICLDPDSQLGIEHVVQLTAGVLRPRLAARADGDLRGHILGTPINPSEFQQQLGVLPPGQVSVDSIWVTDYRDLVPCSSQFPR